MSRVSRSTLTADYLRRRLRYEPTTGVFTWLPRTTGTRVAQWNAKNAGRPAGSLMRGYWRIAIDGCIVEAHRLAWLYVTGEWPTLIDHADGNRGNNAWANLRLATSRQNNANKKRNVNNRSGFKGVRFRHGRYEARITDLAGGLRQIGAYATAEEAHAAYAAEARRLFGDFARPA